MILTRTPFRLQLGGGSTDLPAYYQEYGGFIFTVGINLYMYVALNRPPVDDLIRLKYKESEEVAHVTAVKHRIARIALQRLGIGKMVEIASLADVPDGTGLGSSGSYLVGLLNALHTMKSEQLTPCQLAEEAFNIATVDLGLPDGKQDFYAAALGGFSVLEIEKSGIVNVARPNIHPDTLREFENRLLLFYSGIKRSSEGILNEQQDSVREGNETIIQLKHETKKIGREILAAFEKGDLNQYGNLLYEHWELKKQMSADMTGPLFDALYDNAIKKGALGGKIIGAGGGGFFMVFCGEGAQSAVREIYKEANFREVPFRVDNTGARVLLDHPRNFC